MILQTINTCINYFTCWNRISHKVNSKKGGFILTCNLRRKRHECGSMRHPVTLCKQPKSSFQVAFSISFTIPSRGMMLLIFKVGLHTSTNPDPTAQTKSVFSSLVVPNSIWQASQKGSCKDYAVAQDNISFCSGHGLLIVPF